MSDNDLISRAAAIEAFDDERVDRNYGDVSPESVIKVIESIPAVEAIPIEWLLKKKASCIHMSNRASQTAWLIGELIKEWQKENGGAYK